MSNLLAYRRVKVIAGQPNSQGQEWDSVQGFRIGFSVEYTSRSRPNRAKVMMYNLKQQSIELLERDGAILTLIAGYKQTQSVVIKGDITSVNAKTTDNEIITELTIKDTGLVYRDARFNQHFGPGATNKSIIEAIAREMNLGVGFGVTTIPLLTYEEDVTLFGYARDALDQIVGDFGGEWSIVDGALQVTVADDEPTQASGILLTDDTGKIKVKRAKKGVEVTSLLQPQIKPGRLIRIISKDIEGDFVSRTVKHVGDSDEGQHSTKILARRIESVTYPRS